MCKSGFSYLEQSIHIIFQFKLILSVSKYIKYIYRISIVSGFMPQEVSGQLAFKYMHKDDVRWVMIALRQSIYFQ